MSKGDKMEKRIMIDVLKENQTINEYINNGKVEYKFYNILYYIKEKYGVTVVDLGIILNVTRQTIYNYFQIHTKELPNAVKNKIALIYGEISFDDVIKIEWLVEYETISTLPLLYDQISSDGHIFCTLDGKSNISQMSEAYEVVNYTDSHESHPFIKIKPKYNFSMIWSSYIKEIKKKDYKPKMNNKILEILEKLEQTHSTEYLYLLLRVIQDRVEKDDDKFFIYLTNYIGGLKND